MGDQASIRDQERFEKDLWVKHVDLWIKALGALLIGFGLIANGFFSSQVLQRQQAHFEATERKEWTRRLFDEQYTIYNGIATAAFQMKASKSQREAADALASLREWQAKATLLANSRVLSEIHSACESAERFIESGKRDDRQTEEGKRSPDLTPSCARLITECRIAVLHSGILKLAEHDEAENAVSTAFAEIVNGRNIGLSEPPPADIPSPQ
jgi:hypothetical protein